MPTTHALELTRENLTGSFSREHTPVLTIEPGDTVRCKTLDAGWGLEPMLDIEQERLKFEPRVKGHDDGHALIGPIAITGAQPGMTLEVQINRIIPGSYGFTFAGGWEHPVNKRLGLVESRGIVHQWTLDAASMIGHNQYGHTVSLRPFMGVMGLAPNEPGYHSTTPPRSCGGNIDCKELIVGTTLYLPITVEGAFFYVGDGHGAQGDGESSVTAIECPMEEVELTFNLRDDLPLTLPRAKTPTGWVTFGFDPDLQEATYQALDGMLTLMGEQYGIDRQHALALASVTVDLRVTQIVNDVVGAHAILPDGAIR